MSPPNAADAVRGIVAAAAEEKLWPPDISILREHRRAPPPFPIDVFGSAWSKWICDAAKAAACPVDYVAAPLLAATSALIGHARWAEATPGWREPPHVWCGSVGDSGGGKSPGADAIFRHVLPVIEARMARDFPKLLQEYRARAEFAKVQRELWEREVREAQKTKSAPPLPPEIAEEIEPMTPRLVQSDVTIEKVALVLANASPKGLLMVRDELAGWLLGMNTYNDGARAFWIEAYGGRSYRVDRVKHPQPISISRLAVAWHGGIQPSRLSQVMRDADDGLLARFCWFWPDAVPFNLGTQVPNLEFAIAVCIRLHALEMMPGADGGPAEPIMVPLHADARTLLETFGREMQEQQETAGGLLSSALGKARGLALRLSLVLELMWWAPGTTPPPTNISVRAFLAAATLVEQYLIPMAERVYGDAAVTARTRDAATLARWIVKTRPPEVHVRRLQREVRLPGLGEAASIHDACEALIEAGWLVPPVQSGVAGRTRQAYRVRQEVWELLS